MLHILLQTNLHSIFVRIQLQEEAAAAVVLSWLENYLNYEGIRQHCQAKLVECFMTLLYVQAGRHKTGCYRNPKIKSFKVSVQHVWTDRLEEHKTHTFTLKPEVSV